MTWESWEAFAQDYEGDELDRYRGLAQTTQTFDPDTRFTPDGYAGLVHVATNTLDLLGQIKPDELSDSRPLQHKLACMIMGASIELRQALENAKKGV